LDLAQVGGECDLAILHGTHGTTAAMLLAGRPSLQIPLFLEQEMFARVVTSLGAGLEASPQDAREIIQGINTILDAKIHSQKAQEFADRYRAFDRSQQIQTIVQRLEELAVWR
jgi:UDP:flavonoid glycosyltransferase YjiC (YdhE family)